MSKSAPIVRPREIDQLRYQRALAENWSPLLARVIAGRPAANPDGSISKQVTPDRTQLTDERRLMDIDRAAKRLAMAIIADEIIAIETDHDVDGVTAHSTIKAALNMFGYPGSRIQSYIGHRLKDGYGLTDPVVDRMLAALPRPHLVITADNGSADEARIARLHEQGIDVIVTDHHEIPAAGIPQSAYAVINPTREDCEYGDRFIAGCMVAWLLMRVTAAELFRCGYLDGPVDLDSLLDFVALGTMADCVSMARSFNNRWVVREGLIRMNQFGRPCWRVITRATSHTLTFTEKDLSWLIGPRINARGRLDDAMAGVAFLLSENDTEASQWWALLEQENDQRKRIEADLKQAAMALAAVQIQSKCHGIAVFLPDGHPGVHGIVASRVVEAFGRPTVCLSPVHGRNDYVTGSARSVEGFNVKAALDAIALEYPDLLVKWGGHEGAGGLTLAREGVDQFVGAWDQVVARAHRKAPLLLRPEVRTDGELDTPIDVDLIHSLRSLAPYGREFEEPVFYAKTRVLLVKPIGNGTHLKLSLEVGHQQLEAIWFSAVSQFEKDAGCPLPLAAGDQHTLAFVLEINRFRGQENVQLQILGIA